jgi:peroxiredoxin Q/BCP
MFRRLATTIGAIAVGIVRTVINRGQQSVELAPGDRAPDFALEGSDGRTYRLSDALGRDTVVVAWFPKAFTGGCTAECKSLVSNGGDLRRFAVRHFAASVDAPDANREFAQSLGLDYPILSDPSKETARAYGVLAPSGFAARWTFYIGTDGRILAIDKQVRSTTHGRQVADTLKTLGVPERS